MIIESHWNSLLTWSDFTTYADFMMEFVTTAQQGMKAGRTVEQVADDFLAREHTGFIIDAQRVRDNMQAVYDGHASSLTRHVIVSPRPFEGMASVRL